MDKRLILFLVLAAIILIVTPKLFPPPARPRGTPAPPLPESAAAPAAESTGRVVRADTTTATRADTTAPPIGPADTITVHAGRSVYAISTRGASPVAGTLEDYKSQRPGEGRVELARPRVPLFEYALVSQSGDTVHLDRLPFSVDSTALHDGPEPRVTFSAPTPAGTVSVAYTFSPDSYLVRVRGEITGPGAGARYLIVTLPEGLRSEEADTLDDQRHLAYVLKPSRDDARSIAFGKLEPGQPRVEDGPLTWVASKNKYFVVGLLTDSTQTPFAGVELRGLPHTGKAATHATALVAQPVGANGRFGFTVYAGPQEWRRLLSLGREFQNVNPYGGFFRGVVQPFATLVMRVLLWMHDRLRLTYGWVVVIFGVAVRVLLWPLNQSAMRSQLKMQRIQPELQAIQKKYRNTPDKMQTEMMRLYREHGMSPFSPVAGCLPMLIPMPVLFALYFVFLNTIEFRGVSFLWLADISQKDPYYILPVLMGVSMFLLSWIGMRSSPPNAQAKMMGYIFPFVMTFLFVNFAAGLNLYYAVQNIAALPQQWLIARERSKAAPPPPAKT